VRALPALRFVCFLGIGYRNHIDVEEATRRGVVVAYTPDYGATSVAEHALGLVLALTRHIATGFVSMRAGRWEPGSFMGGELRGKTLGLVGLGPIGLGMAARAGIRMRLLGWTGARARPGAPRAHFVPLEAVRPIGRGERHLSDNAEPRTRLGPSSPA
jgi:D-3-phosphoglycerate dehydrogenase